jgi:oligopeptide transport system substrate-binding protein
MQDTVSNTFYLALFEGLVQYDPRTSKGIPAMAQSWETSADGLRSPSTCAMRSGGWHAVTAQDFVYGWLRTLAPETASGMRTLIGMVVKGADAYNAGKGKAEARRHQGCRFQDLPVQLLGPAPLFCRHDRAQRVRACSKWAIEKYGDQWTKPSNIVVNGAYILKEWKAQDYILVTKNDKYCGRQECQAENHQVSRERQPVPRTTRCSRPAQLTGWPTASIST